MTLTELALDDLALAGLVLCITVGISLACGLGLEASIAIAAARMAVQLGAVALLFKVVLEQASPLCTAVAALVMVAVAGGELARRQELCIRGWYTQALCHLTLLVGVAISILCPLAGMIGPEPWYAPRYVLPVLALLSGSTLASASVALQTLTHGAMAERGAIEARMAQGARRFIAFAPLLRHALKAALSPFLQAMSASGLLALPGTMAGQMLAGADPLAAAKFQMLLTVALAGAGGLGAVTAALGGVLLLSDRRHRLRLDRLRRAAPRPRLATRLARWVAAGRRLGGRLPWLRVGSGALP